MNSVVFNSVCVYYIVIVDCCQLFFKYFLVRVARFELARPKTGDFKSPAATCYAILALKIGTSKKSESFRSTDQANTATPVLPSYRRPFG